MIRSFNLLVPRPEFGIAEFHDHWRHPHGTIGRQIPGLESLVQAHRIHSDVLGPQRDEFAGVAIIAVDDSPAGMIDRFSDPVFLTGIVPDEPNFMDVRRNLLFTSDEEVLVSRRSRDDAGHPTDHQWDVLERPTSVQLLQFVHLDGSPDWAGDQDAALGRRIGAFRHARNHPTSNAPGDFAVSWSQAVVVADGVAIRGRCGRRSAGATDAHRSGRTRDHHAHYQ